MLVKIDTIVATPLQDLYHTEVDDEITQLKAVLADAEESRVSGIGYPFAQVRAELDEFYRR
ncbi:MAG: hypothetical protein LBS97_02245 [Treponema sp.]|jgi:hypothetical protein|nr:hypothetical protein [Treponema sp.]